MPIPAKRLVYEFDRKFDRFKSDFHYNLRLEDKLSILNEAARTYYENAVELAESNAQINNDLRSMRRNEKEVSVSSTGGRYSVAKLPDDVYQVVRQRVEIFKEPCGVKEVAGVLFQGDDMNFSIDNAFWKSSYEWEHVIVTQGDKSLYIWHNNDFTVNKLIIDYYKVLNEFHAPTLEESGSYVDWNGKTQSNDIPLEMDNMGVSDKIVDIAILMARADIGDTRDFQLKVNQIVNTERNKF